MDYMINVMPSRLTGALSKRPRYKSLGSQSVANWLSSRHRERDRQQRSISSSCTILIVVTPAILGPWRHEEVLKHHPPECVRLPSSTRYTRSVLLC